MKMDYTLYLITDRSLMSTKTLQEAVEQATLGGCTMVQLREKNIESLDFYTLARDIKLVTDSYHIPIIINDRIDIALSVNAAGVHVGQNDIPVSVARKIIGKHMILGVSASSVQEALQAQNDGADYLGVGAMLPTRTKTDAKIVSMDELQRIRQAVSIPIVAIGGINKENAASFRDIGVDGLAVVSAILAQPDIKAAAEELKFMFQKGKSV
ncbi:MAG TPA: thiamine phosphate synthase [Clostridiaceae bacterium]|jgi:thiamine-phosphate pyrophosphorylase|nr:thiamine phosphate synthase [Clostridiaceae bacterium]